MVIHATVDSPQTRKDALQECAQSAYHTAALPLSAHVVAYDYLRITDALGMPADCSSILPV